jgi:signal transduction histidine kinase
MTGPRSLLGRLITSIVIVNAVVIVASTGQYLWRGYASRTSEAADFLNHGAHEMARDGTLIRGDGTVDEAAVVDASTGKAVAGSDRPLLDLVEPVLGKGLTGGLLVFEPGAGERLNAAVATVDGPGGRRTAVAAHRGELETDLLPWVVHEILTDILPTLGPLFVATVALAAFVIRKGLTPVLNLSRQAASLGPRRLDVRLGAEGLPEEIYPLVRAVNQALDRVAEGAEGQRRFAANAAHELRTPLAVIKARCDGLDDVALRQSVMRDVDRMAAIVNQLLDLSKVGAQQVQPTEAVDLGILARETVAALFPLAHLGGREVAFAGDGVRAVILGSYAVLEGALRNIVENAIRITPPGTAVEVRQDGHRLSVSDHGPGIPLAERRVIFEPFTRGSGARGSGAGLGLSIAVEAVRAHGGELSVESAPSGGALFVIDFSTAARPGKPAAS